MGSNSSG
jgi:alpha-tubulin suppressor-like RCC1 family protein